ncbi:peptidyl-prolyl cis-trans isomerase SurA [Pontibacter aydingkolensis]|uniref:Peptidylprolyl isomerase n=1 Tax=Pontibacter aydingkolensis TaxID=1911536 RepID=A0ABS7CPA5_9BACT|nr:peptidylprolyl isomerase [Pontibacter aydingkolensis]MBW7465663.1 peptidylprolyl isomerase [Pontibacter aydingkolensis]
MRSNHLLVAAALLVAGCTATKKNDSKEPAIATLGTEPISTTEFQYVYEKNNAGNDDAYTRENVTDYLNLYTNFKLKVKEAESRGLDTTMAFKRELEGYKEQLAQPYLSEKSVTDQLVKQAYDRLSQEVNASHILLTLQQDAAPEDTLAAYNKAVELRQRALSGEDFGKLAQAHSQDPSAADNKGNLGYFTSMQMVYPFEDAAYKTPAGQISMPVRTRFGYHLIKVNDKRQARGEVKVAHIMVRATPGMPKADSLAAKQRIDAIYKRLQRNESWDKLAAEFSEDANSAQNGGDLPWFGTGRMIPNFEDAAFALNKEDEITKPLLTPYGWHIIKLIDKRGLPPFEDMEQNLRNKIAKDSRSELNRAAFLKRIKAENNFTEVAATKAAALSKANAELLQGKWSYDTNDKTLNQPLFTIQGKPYTVGNFYTFVKEQQRPRTTGTPEYAMSTLYDAYVDKSLVEYERANLENKYTDYRMLVKEYHDGILLFQLMDEKVWSKAVEDSVGLKAFFEQNKEKYKWGPRVQATVISAANKDLLNKAQQQLATRRYPVKSANLPDILFEQNKAELTKDASLKLNEFAEILKGNPSLSIDVNGHADAREAAANQNISDLRAQRVVKYLTEKGVPAAQIKVNALGKTKQAGPDNTETGRRRNRRASFALYSSDVNALADNLNASNPLDVQITEKKFQKGENKVLDAVKWEKGTYTLQQNGREYLIIIDEVLEPAYKQLNETRGVAISDYQNYLEQQWVNQLREKYPVKVNDAEIEKLVRK